MQGHIAQAQALVIIGNAVLRGHGAAPPRWDDEPAFRSCVAVEFFVQATPGGYDGEAPGATRYAADPGEWLERLRADGVIGLRLRHTAPAATALAEREAVAFANGGGAWAIEAVDPLRSDLWFGHWAANVPDRPDQRIWRVRYARAARGVPHGPTPASRGDLEAAQAALRSVLQRIAAFADAQRLSSFAACFARGLAALDSPSPMDAPGRDGRRAAWLGLPLAARQLAAACDAAWVFGGMGSWNDLGFDGDAQREYRALSEELWHALVRAAVVVADAPFDPGGRVGAGEPGTARFTVSQEPGNVSTIDYGRLHGVAYDRAIQARDDGDAGVRLRIERFAGPLLVSLRPPERARLEALGLPVRDATPHWCADAPFAADLVVEPPARGEGAWRVRYGIFDACVAPGALAIGIAGRSAFLAVDALAEPAMLSLPPGLAQLDAGPHAYPWREPAEPATAAPPAFERIGPVAVRHRDGWTVALTGRYTMRYTIGPRAIEAEADPGPGLDGAPRVLLHRATLVGWTFPHEREALSDTERERILQRMVEAGGALGWRVSVA